MEKLTDLFWLFYELPAIPKSIWISFVVAVVVCFFLSKSRKNYLLLPELPRVSGPGELDVTVVIPARDEEQNIARCVESFAPLGVRVLVVDDQSTDRTAELAAKAGAEVIAAPPLKRFVLGKPNACQAGADLAETKWILFVDADTWYHRSFLWSLINFADLKGLVLVSCFPRQVCVGIAERMVLPYAFALYFCGVSAAGVRRLATGESLANGQCMLFQRQAYQFIGGHGAVANSVTKDMALTARVKRNRMAQGVVRAEHLAKVRMYTRYREILLGFRKNSFRFLMMNPRCGFQVTAASIALTSVGPLVAWLLYKELWWAAFSLAILPPYALAPWYRGLFRALWSLPAIYVFQRIAIDSMIATSFGRKTMWKGRAV